MTTTATTIPLAPTEYQQPSRLTLLLRYMRRNKGLVIGFLILIGSGIVHRHRAADDRSKGCLSAVSEPKQAAQRSISLRHGLLRPRPVWRPWWSACGRPP